MRNPGRGAATIASDDGDSHLVSRVRNARDIPEPSFPAPIQALEGRLSGDPVTFVKRHWIPACAGMTTRNMA